MTSPSAAHTGIAMTPAEAERHALADQLTDQTVRQLASDLLANPDSEVMPAILQAAASTLVDAGHASWCPVCGGTGQTYFPRGTCTRCRGGRLNPFHGCTFTTDDPCACTTRCRVYRPQETPTP